MKDQQTFVLPLPDSGYNLIVILGPTASGKTAVAAHVAYHLHSAVISADSRQVYKGMDIGSGKDREEYFVNGVPVPCYLIDLHEPGYKYNVFEYQQDFYKVFASLRAQGQLPVLCGGSGLYIEAVLKGYPMPAVPPDPSLRAELEKKTDEELVSLLASMKKLHNRTDTSTRKRLIRAIEIETYLRQHPDALPQYPEIVPFVVGISYPREIQRERITQRLHQRLEKGLVEEVEALLQKGVSVSDLMYYGLEYKWVVQYLVGMVSYEEMVSRLNTAIHQFAKRQMTWFRKMQREGFDIHWIEGELPFEEKVRKIISFIQPAQ